MASLTGKVCGPIFGLALRGRGSICKILKRYKKVHRDHRPEDAIRPRKIRQNNTTTTQEVVEKHRVSPLAQQQDVIDDGREDTEVLRDYKYVSPEFLPNPNMELRDRLLEKLEREDMYRRRANVYIPEFYVGSILAVTVSDKNAPGRKNRFVGICIERQFQGLRATFTLRNVVSNQGMEIRYQLYSPLILDIQVLLLEKRLDEHLRYLRDCPLEYSTVPFDMEPRPKPSGNYVPLNKTQVPLNPKPWEEKWERQDLLGLQKIQHNFTKKQQRKIELNRKEKFLNKFDLMKDYRESINDVEKAKIYREVLDREEKIKKKRDQEKSVN